MSQWLEMREAVHFTVEAGLKLNTAMNGSLQERKELKWRINFLLHCCPS